MKKIRGCIAETPATWQRLVRSRPFKDGLLQLEGDSLKRPPRGYDPDLPLIDELRRKDFITVARLTERDACHDDFLKQFNAICRSAKPFVKYITEAIELDF